MEEKLEECRKMFGNGIADCMEDIINVLKERKMTVGRSAFILSQTAEIIESAAKSKTLDVICRSAQA